MMDQSFLDQLAACVDDAGFVTDADVIAPHLVETRGKWQGSARVMLRPTTTDQVSAICKLCSAADIAIVPQGGNTGTVGGQIASQDEVLLSLERMNQIRALDAANSSITVEAGVILSKVQDAANEAGMLFPLSLAAEQSCTIGGNLATNAGGTAVLAYGNMRDLCLGLEVVLADGRVMTLMDGLRKDNTGYDLKHLFIGAEGTLGIITAAVLKLFPNPQSHETFLIAVPNPQAAITLLGRAQAASGNRVTACEIMPEVALGFLEKHGLGPCPLQPTPPFALLLEVADGPREALEQMVADALADGTALDAVRAESESQAKALWKLREDIPDVQKREGGSIKHDIAVPVSAIPDFWQQADSLVQQLVPGARICAFGHIGDGNLHFNISQPEGADKDEFLAQWDRVESAMFKLVDQFGGTISAEHGIGQLKTDALAAYKDATALAVMRQIKHTLDPRGIMNPGKLLR